MLTLGVLMAAVLSRLSGRWVWAGGLGLVFAVAFGARLSGIGLFITPDEDNWMRRAGNFARGLEQGRYERTYQSGHPGVTTMWLTTIALGPATAELSGITGPDPMVTLTPGFMETLERARVVFAAFNAGLVALIAFLAWRLIGAWPATLGAAFVALDPFLAAHSQVVHVDGLSAGLITVAVLSGALYWWGGRGRGYVVLCGVATGLAVLTKAPSLFLGLFVPAMALTSRFAPLAAGPPRPIRDVLISIVACGAIAMIVFVTLWPAVWAAPIDTIARAVEYTREQAETPHLPGNYFRSQVTPDPGPAFYPVALAFRMTPLALLGLASLAVLLPPKSLRWQTILLTAFGVGFLIFLTLPSKKLDRYAVPLFPTLALLAGLGMWVLWERVREKAAPLLSFAVVGAVVVAQAFPLLTVAPYSLAYYNPLLGGAPAARRVLLVGWGEGLDQVAAYLNAEPDAATSKIAIYFPMVRNFQGMVQGTVQRFGDPPPADYVVDYISAAQRRQTPSEVTGLPPALTVEINGIQYARVYRLSPPRQVTNP